VDAGVGVLDRRDGRRREHDPAVRVRVAHVVAGPGAGQQEPVMGRDDADIEHWHGALKKDNIVFFFF
jgi:hypothetical protein